MQAHTSPWRGRRVLVTGCTGFLGTAVTRELLDRGAVVVGLVRDRAGGAGFAREQATEQFVPVHGRVEDAIRLHTALAVHEVTAAFHLASSDPFGTDRGTAALFQAAGLYSSRLPVVVARPAGQLRLAPDDQAPAVPVGVARLGELFGGGDRKVFRVVPRTIIGLVTGDPAPIPADGPAREFMFVRDAARACLAVAEAAGAGGAGSDFTFRSGWVLTERQMAALVSETHAGKRLGTASGEPPANPLGWRPSVALAEALGETVAWYREFLRTRFFGTRVGEPAMKAA